MEDRVVELLDFVKSGIETGVEQWPLVAQEIVAWNFYSSLILFVVTLSLTLGLAWVTFKGWKRFTTMKNPEEIDAMWTAFGFLATIVSLPFPVINGVLLVKVIVAPKLVIIDYLRGLL